jgi:hypothetical protein
MLTKQKSRSNGGRLKKNDGRRFPPPWTVGVIDAVRHKRLIMGGLVALCGLTLLVQHVAERGSDFHGDHLLSGIVMLAVAVIVWCLPSEANEEQKAPRNWTPALS